MAKNISKRESQEIAEDEPAAVQGGSFIKMGFTDPNALVSEGFKADVFGKLEEGQEMRAIFLGEGTHKLINNRNARKGEPDKVSHRTWRFAAGANVIITILGGRVEGPQYGLNEKLMNIRPGTELVLQHHGQEEISGGQRVNRIEVFTGKFKGNDVDVRSLLADPVINHPQLPPHNPANGTTSNVA